MFTARYWAFLSVVRPPSESGLFAWNKSDVNGDRAFYVRQNVVNLCHIICYLMRAENRIFQDWKCGEQDWISAP